MKKILFSIFVALVSATLYATPVQRTFFKSLVLGNDITKTQIAKAFGVGEFSFYLTEQRQSAGMVYTYVNDTYFGGIKWNYIEFSTVSNKLGIIRFNMSSENDNSQTYDSLKKALTEKYGTPIVDDYGIMWFDEKTAVYLTYVYSESKGGDMRYYTRLEYADLELIVEANQIISDEL